jgi:threonylcarbamoyladenosine tRNA methylthiotransferase MtaB
MPNSTSPKSVAVHTLGCKLNYAETSTLANEFAQRGFSVVPFGSNADVLLLNTCSVTLNAEKECRQIIRRVLRGAPNTFVIVTGCYAQLRPDEIAAIEGVDLVLGDSEKSRLFDHLGESTKDHLGEITKQSPAVVSVNQIEDSAEFHTAATSEADSRSRAFLKVQDGCDYSCSYCTIPMARGGSRSGSVQSVVSEAIRLSEDGFHEIVLSGVNIGDFGAHDGSSFLELARALTNEVRATARLRISSIEPNLLSDEVIELVAGSEKWCPHFHIPLQSGSPKVLRAMQRRYNRDLYSQRVENIRSVIPDACIGADVIVGFPGETSEDFIETVSYLDTLGINYLHVFTYSERPNTRAVTLPGAVPMAVRRERNEVLRRLSERLLRSYHSSQIGRNAIAVIERARPESERVLGYTANYVRVSVPAEDVRGAALVRVHLDREEHGAVFASVEEVLSYRSQEVLSYPSQSELLPILC